MSTRVQDRSGFTLKELVVLVVLLLVTYVVLTMMSGRQSLHGLHGGSVLKDSTQVRGIVQALIISATSNNGSFPLPSLLDAENATVPEKGEEKDTTGNILSSMVYQGLISTEMLITPSESNTGNIQEMMHYSYSKPAAAADPAKALWDPAFRGTPIDEVRAGTTDHSGHQSYAPMLPVGRRRAKQWVESYDASVAVFGNRGPMYAPGDEGAGRQKWTLLEGPLGTGSNTLLIHGGRTTWEGNIGYADGSVRFETSPTPEGVLYAKLGASAKQKDNLFVNEMDEEGGDGPGGVDLGLNAYLRPIAKRGADGGVVVWRD